MIHPEQGFLKKAGPEEKKRLESIFRDKEQYAAMESSQRKELIKEYMFLQTLEDPYFQKRRTKDRAAQQHKFRTESGMTET